MKSTEERQVGTKAFEFSLLCVIGHWIRKLEGSLENIYSVYR